MATISRTIRTRYTADEMRSYISSMIEQRKELRAVRNGFSWQESRLTILTRFVTGTVDLEDYCVVLDLQVSLLGKFLTKRLESTIDSEAKKLKE